MKVGILAVGQVAPKILIGIQDGLVKTFPDTDAVIVEDVLPVPQTAYDKKRSQYNSNLVLSAVRVYGSKKPEFHRILGVIDLDIFTSGLNYAFGEAYVPGSAALISLWRLKPEFYHDKPDLALYVLRTQKEAVHELGHTLGVQHCPRSTCVMHFSNSIFDTDRKQNLLCDECYLQAAIAIRNLG
jgi:archaemetzincin